MYFLTYIFLDCHIESQNPITIILNEIENVSITTHQNEFISKVQQIINNNKLFLNENFSEFENYISRYFSLFLKSDFFYHVNERVFTFRVNARGREQRLLKLQNKLCEKSFFQLGPPFKLFYLEFILHQIYHQISFALNFSFVCSIRI